MALTRTNTLMIADVRKLADAQGTSASLRHPDTDITEYLNRAMGSFYRLLTLAIPDQRYVASDVIATVAGTSTYTLASDLDSVFSVDLSANGTKRWLKAWEPNEYASLTSPDVAYSGIPLMYRIQGSNVVLLPAPTAVYTCTVWYLPTVDQHTTGTDTLDTINRLDDYITSFAAQLVAMKDKQWDLYDRLGARIAQLAGEVETQGRLRDRNSPARIVDERVSDRCGRTRWRPR